MDKPIDHQRCSELLPGFLSGALSAPEIAAVDEHLSACEECRAERRALEILAAPDDEPLTARERSALESGVMAGIAKETGERPIVVPLERKKPIGQRVAQVLGAAATIAVLASLVYFGTLSGGDDDTAGGSGETASVEELEAPVADAGKAKGRRSGAGGGSAGSDTSQGTLEAASGDTATGTSFKAPTPTFSVDGDPYTSGELQKRGESSLASVTFANAYSANDASGRLALLDQLVEAARAQAGDEVAEQVERCGAQVLDTQDPTIPTFGSIGELDGRDVLVLGFAWTRSSSGPLDLYMVWAWERGSCEVAVDFIDGRIETQN